MAETELDNALKQGRFCIVRDLDTFSSAMVDKEYELVDGLRDLLLNKYDEDAINVGEDMWPVATFYVDVILVYLNEQLISTLSDYLSCHAPQHCVLIGVYDYHNLHGEGAGKSYKGRAIISTQEIAVEESLSDLWNEQIIVE